jgi:hypothetical protein
VTETIKAADGSDRHRVRIGPFETREAAVAGSVVLDGGNALRVLNINPGSSGVVQLIGLNITRGYIDDSNVRRPP